ncbi:hypothetical protein [Ascidiimonas sp. W6]|uniref:hypothetical protein n=1 Tax=Ascidiimonas meishanensis TaxID=3128903 RepID=UPI0030EC6371
MKTQNSKVAKTENSQWQTYMKRTFNSIKIEMIKFNKNLGVYGAAAAAAVRN